MPHRKRPLHTTSALALILGSCFAAGTPALAQETSLVLDEIVVTARQRSENLQDVPLSETAFSARAIEDARINTADDFLQLTPNVTLANSQSVGVSFMTIRGMSQVRNGEAPVAVVVDGVLQINGRQFTQSMLDLESIEVLRGPQGALYGRNAIGGAILISTKQPTEEFEGYVRGGLGSGQEYLLEGAVSGPVIEDRILYRISARYQDIEGYQDNIYLGGKVDPYQDITVRGQLSWQITDNLSADLRANISRSEGGGNNFQYQPVILDSNCGVAGLDFSLIDANRVAKTHCANNISENERDIDEYSATLTYETPFATFSNIFSYNRVEEYLASDQYPYTSEANYMNLFGFGGTSDGTQTQYVDLDAWSNEFRITSPADQAFRWMAGVYYLETERFISTTVGSDLRQGIAHVERTPSINPQNPTVSFIADDNHNKAWAVFGNVAYDLTEDLEIAAALRYDKDKRIQDVSPLSTSGVPGARNERTYDKLQPKITAKYQLTEDANIYASWGEGFRSGQFNQNGVAAVAAGAGTPGVNDVVEQEESETFEIGFKSELFDNRLRLNGSLFRTETNPLYFVFIGSVSAQVLVNIDKVTLKGGELEAVASLADGLDAYAAVGFTDSEINAYTPNPAAVGNKAPYVADTTLNLGMQYRKELTGDLGIVARADYERRGAQYWDPENSTKRDPLNLVGLRLGLEQADGKWSLTGSIRNLTDEDYNAEWVSGGYVQPALGRTWHLDLKVNF